jgi:hypothetical protein
MQDGRGGKPPLSSDDATRSGGSDRSPMACVDQFPDVGEVVVIALCRKVQMVRQPHGCFQPRMEEGAGEDCRVDLLHAAHQS